MILWLLNVHLWQVWQKVNLGLCVHLLDSDLITFKIPQDHHKITYNTMMTLCHREGSQHFFSSRHTRTATVFYTPSYPSFTPLSLLGFFSTPLADIFTHYCILLSFFLLLCLYPSYLRSLAPNNGQIKFLPVSLLNRGVERDGRFLLNISDVFKGEVISAGLTLQWNGKKIMT